MEGFHFTSNFRVSDQTFDPNAGAFTDARGATDFFLGDHIDVTAANGFAYAVWTDTRGGNQDIFFDKYRITPAPQAPTDRFSANNTRQTATNLGTVSAQEVFPRLNLLPGGSNEWFSLTAGADGQLSVTANASNGGNNLQVEVTDASGNVIAPTGTTPLLDASGNVIGRQLNIASTSGVNYFVHVSSNAQTAVLYTLTLSTLTADLGTQVEGSQPGTVAQGAQNIYRLVAGVGGTLQVTLAGDNALTGALNLTILGADGQTVLTSDTAGVGPGKTEQLSIQVTPGQLVFLQVSGANLTSASGAFTLQFVNLDQYEASSLKTLFVPTVGDPTSIVAAKLAGDSTTSLLTTNTDATDTLSVLKSNGDGTFQAPRQYDIGPGQAGSLTAGNRQIAVADLTGHGVQDVIVPNFRAANISVLLGSAGGFQPQRTFDAVASPDALVTGDFGNGKTDVAVLQNFPQFGGVSKLAILLGRGDGTFQPATLYSTIFGNGANSMVTGDFNGDGHLDIIVFSKNQPQAEIFLGNGDGTFQAGRAFDIGENTFNAAAVDLNGDGHLDLVTTSTNSGNVYVQLGNGDGTFQAPVAFTALTPRPGDNVGVFGLAVANFPVPAGAPAAPTGLHYGSQNIVVTAQARSGQGAAEVLLLPELLDASGHYAGLGAAIVLANVGTAGNIAVGDFGSGGTDLAVADKGGVTIIYGKALTVTPNTTAATARALGNADHVVTLPQAIVTGHEDAFYTYTVPKEVVAGSGDQVIDFSALLQYVGGAGLQLDVTDANGLLGTAQFHAGQAGSGRRFRVVAAQGDALQVHIFGLPGTVAGFGAYTLDIDVLPQVVSVQAESPLPGAPATSLVLTFQGDRLDPTSAQVASNYVVTVNGNQVIPQSVILDSASNTAVAGSGLTYLAAARQTVTLSFAALLPVGSYEITLKPNILAAPFSASESAILVPDATLSGHVLVSAKTGVIHNGSDFIVPNLVTAGVNPDPTAISNGTAFLTQLQNDLSAVLDRDLKNGMSDAAITAAINAEILARFAALFVAGSPALAIGVIWLDPVSLGVQAPQGTAANYSLASNVATNNISQSYVSVGGNVEVVVLAGLAGTFKLDVADVPQQARGGAVVLDSLGEQVTFAQTTFTQALRAGTSEFTVVIADAVKVVPFGPPPINPGPVDGSPGSTSTAGIAGETVATVAQTASAILISALLTGFPDNSSGAANFGGQSNGNVSPTNGTTQTSANGLAASTGADGGGGGDQAADGHSSFIESAIDRVFLNLPDSVSGFVDLADQLMQDGEDAAKTLADRINAFLKSQKPPAPMTMPPESLRPMPEAEWRQGDKETRKQGDSPSSGNEEVANASPTEYTEWHANEYGLTLFLASGLGYIGLRDLADRDAESRKKRR